MKLKFDTLKSLVIYVTYGYNVAQLYMMEMIAFWFAILSKLCWNVYLNF